MGRGRIFIGIGLFALLGVALGYVLATGYITVKLFGFGAASAVDWSLLWQQRT